MDEMTFGRATLFGILGFAGGMLIGIYLIDSGLIGFMLGLLFGIVLGIVGVHYDEKAFDKVVKRTKDEGWIDRKTEVTYLEALGVHDKNSSSIYHGLFYLGVNVSSQRNYAVYKKNNNGTFVYDTYNIKTPIKYCDSKDSKDLPRIEYSYTVLKNGHPSWCITPRMNRETIIYIPEGSIRQNFDIEV